MWVYWYLDPAGCRVCAELMQQVCLRIHHEDPAYHALTLAMSGTAMSLKCKQYIQWKGGFSALQVLFNAPFLSLELTYKWHADDPAPAWRLQQDVIVILPLAAAATITSRSSSARQVSPEHTSHSQNCWGLADLFQTAVPAAHAMAMQSKLLVASEPCAADNMPGTQGSANTPAGNSALPAGGKAAALAEPADIASCPVTQLQATGGSSSRQVLRYDLKAVQEVVPQIQRLRWRSAVCEHDHQEIVELQSHVDGAMGIQADAPLSEMQAC